MSDFENVALYSFLLGSTFLLERVPLFGFQPRTTTTTAPILSYPCTGWRIAFGCNQYFRLLDCMVISHSMFLGLSSGRILVLGKRLLTMRLSSKL
jgi:hypothetical protein